MANFDQAYQKILALEGNYNNDPDDLGGETYKGIARKFWPQWEGWAIVDSYANRSNFPILLDTDTKLQALVKEFYRVNFWDKVMGDYILNQDIAFNLFDFAINAGIPESIKTAQKSVGAAADGVIGKITLGLLNSYDRELFLAKFDLAKIDKYVDIVDKYPKQIKYFFGWVKRVIKN